MKRYDTFWPLKWNWFLGFNVIGSKTDHLYLLPHLIEETIPKLITFLDEFLLSIGKATEQVGQMNTAMIAVKEIIEEEPMPMFHSPNCRRIYNQPGDCPDRVNEITARDNEQTMKQIRQTFRDAGVLQEDEK